MPASRSSLPLPSSSPWLRSLLHRGLHRRVRSSFLFFIILWAFSRISPVGIYVKRLLHGPPVWDLHHRLPDLLHEPVLPGLPRHRHLPFGIHIYAESVEFACYPCSSNSLSASRSSSSSRRQPNSRTCCEGAGRMGLPAEFALTLGMMIRYLFVFGYMLPEGERVPRPPAASIRSTAPAVPLPAPAARVYHRDHVHPLLRTGRAGLHEHALPGIWQGQPSLHCEKTAPAGTSGHSSRSRLIFIIAVPVVIWLTSLPAVLTIYEPNRFFIPPAILLLHDIPLRSRVHHEHRADRRTLRAPAGTGMAWRSAIMSRASWSRTGSGVPRSRNSPPCSGRK